MGFKTDEVRSDDEVRETIRRAEIDQEYVSSFVIRVRELFPRCPAEREQGIAEHACQKYSGHVGRSVPAKSLDENAVRLAVVVDRTFTSSQLCLQREGFI